MQWELVFEVQEEYEMTCDEVVLYGLSRGASTIVNVLGKWIKEEKKLPNIKAVILESPFAHCEDALEGFAENMHMPLFLMRFFVKRCFKEYTRHKNAPIDWINEIKKPIPFLFICTEEDRVVPAKSTKRLSLARQKDCADTYTLVFKSGIHGCLVYYAPHAIEYAEVIHAFYKFCELPL